MKVEWGWVKAILVFGGLVCKGLALQEPLSFEWGVMVHEVAGVIWPAFDGAFMWLLRPPSQEGEKNEN